MLTILCPITSRNCGTDRAQQPLFHALLPSIDAIGMWPSIRLVLGYDSDDEVWSIPESREIDRPIEWVELEAGRQLTAIWNKLERVAWPWEYLLPANDDLAFQTSPLPAMETLKQRNGFGTVAFADEAFPGLPTFYVVGKLHVEIFGTLYPLPWGGAHQDPWIADVYRPWKASEIDDRFKVHNRIGAPGNPVGAPRFEYGPSPPGYRNAVMEGRRRVNEWLKQWWDSKAAEKPQVGDCYPLWLTDDKLCETPTLI